MNMIEKRKAMAGQGGFTLIELLVVVAILAVLAGAAIIGIGAMRENALATACKSDRDTIETAAEAYDVDHIGDPDHEPGTATMADLTDPDDTYLRKITEADWDLSHPDDVYVATAAQDGKYDSVLADCNPTP